ncbi:MAG: hypothetical protein QY320_13100 [Gammaproteobacteria bacterium]|nr:MAG: hypothetical protein QY320_13100 [Gammaproteobacteria bacterium]
MATSSVIGLTGQNWKLALGAAALLIGSFAPLATVTGISWTAGTVLAVAGYAFVCLMVRCPACRSRWFWQAALDAGLYGPLFRRPECPQCRHDFARTPRERA